MNFFESVFLHLGFIAGPNCLISVLNQNTQLNAETKKSSLINCHSSEFRSFCIVSSFVIVDNQVIKYSRCSKYEYLEIMNDYSETLNKEYIERIHQMSYSSLSDNGMLQIFSFFN